MLTLIRTLCIFALTASARVHQQRASSHIAVTNYVLPLIAAPHPHPVTPSSRHLHKRRAIRSCPSAADNPREDADDDNPVADVQQDVLTLGGRVYMTNITLASRPYTLVIDTGSSDTWIAASTFQCVGATRKDRLPQKRCGFGTLYDVEDSASFRRIDNHAFGVKYSDGEFLTGIMGTEELGIGGVHEDELSVRQTIGVVQRGWWMGDGVSSGLMGLAYPTLASGMRELNYTSVIWSLFADGEVPPVFSLALSRPTVATPAPGGLLAIGGIPDIPHDPDFVSVTIHPIVSNTYAYYSIPVDGFSVIPPLEHSPSPSPLPASTQNYTNYPLKMIIDSGSSLNHLPDAVADYIASLFSPRAVFSTSSGGYLVACSAAAPRVGVIIGGKTFWIHESDLMNKGPGAVKVGTPGVCTVGILKAGNADIVLGDTWLKGVLAVFDVGAGEMRFAGRENY